MKPASATPMSILLLMETIQDVTAKGTINIINGSGGKIGKALATHPDVKKWHLRERLQQGNLL